MRASIEDNPGLLRDIEDAARTPIFKRLKRHVVAEFMDVGEEAAQQLADDITDALKEMMLEFDPESGG